MRSEDLDSPFDPALCRGGPYEVWYPNFHDANGDEFLDDGTIWEQFGDTSSAYDKARAVCNQCPIKELCLQDAMERKERFGMWGGLTPIERRRIERRDRRKRLQERRKQEALDSVHGVVTTDTLDEE